MTVRALVPPAGRLNRDSYAGMPGQRAHAAHQLSRSEHPAVVCESRCEVDDLDGLAGIVMERRAHDRRAAVIGLLNTRHALELHREAARVGRSLLRIEQSVERRCAVEARQAAPHDACAPVNQRADRTVADQGQIQ